MIIFMISLYNIVGITRPGKSGMLAQKKRLSFQTASEGIRENDASLFVAQRFHRLQACGPIGRVDAKEQANRR